MNFVESMELPPSLEDLYADACDDDRVLAESLSNLTNPWSATMLV